MKTHFASKPYVIVVKDGKVIHASKIRSGSSVVTDGQVEWFTTELAFNTRLEELKPKKAQ